MCVTLHPAINPFYLVISLISSSSPQNQNGGLRHSLVGVSLGYVLPPTPTDQFAIYSGFFFQMTKQTSEI